MSEVKARNRWSSALKYESYTSRGWFTPQYRLDEHQNRYGRFVEYECVLYLPDAGITAYCLATALNELAQLLQL